MSDSFRLTFEAIGTQWVIDCFDVPISKLILEDIILKRIEVFDQTYSRFRKDSLITQISQRKGKYKFPKDSKDFFQQYNKLSKITEEKFTLLIGNTLEEAGYDSDYSLKPGKINDVPKESEIYTFNFPILNVKKPYILDFGGLGKGYLIDIIAELLEENNIKSYVIDGGGDIYFKNKKQETLKVGLEHPMNDKQVVGVVNLVQGQSICASSGNRRRWKGFHHIINPKSLSSPENILATWVIAKNAITADGIATCLFLESPKKLLKYYSFEYFILYPDFSFEKSKKFNAELFIKKENLVK
jgi:thiamine biosynthesis lipoprotein